MSLINNLERILTNFGKNNSPTLVAMGIATAKGIFRPMFTMMDKKEDYQTKKYTAIREGLTELIAIPVYWGSGVATKFLAKKLAQPKFFMDKKVYEQFKAGSISTEVETAVKHAKKLAAENLPKITTSLSFAGVCVAALFLIPIICSATIKPIMKNFALNKKEDKTPDFTAQTLRRPQSQYNNKVFKPFSGSTYSGMKVGGV